MIQSFADKVTEQVWRRMPVRGLHPELHRRANRKLHILHRAADLRDLRIPPGNHLEKLAGTRIGQHAIRVNDQYRICFTWTDTGPADVELTDYH